MGEYIGRSDSDAVFDYSKGDPFLKTKTHAARKEKGARIHFKDAPGEDQYNAVSKFIKGGLDHMKNAKTDEEKRNAREALFDTMDDLELADEKVDIDKKIIDQLWKDKKCNKKSTCKIPTEYRKQWIKKHAGKETGDTHEKRGKDKK